MVRHFIGIYRQAGRDEQTGGDRDRHTQTHRRTHGRSYYRRVRRPEAYLCHQRRFFLALASVSVGPEASSVAAGLLPAVVPVVLGVVLDVVPAVVPPLAPSGLSDLVPTVLPASAPDVVSARVLAVALAVAPAAELDIVLSETLSAVTSSLEPGSDRAGAGDPSGRGFFFVSSASFVAAERGRGGSSEAAALEGGDGCHSYSGNGDYAVVLVVG